MTLASLQVQGPFRPCSRCSNNAFLRTQGMQLSCTGMEVIGVILCVFACAGQHVGWPRRWRSRDTGTGHGLQYADKCGGDDNDNDDDDGDDDKSGVF